MNHSGGDKNNDNSGFTLLRYAPVVSAVVSIVIFAILCLQHYDNTDLVNLGITLVPS